MDIGSCLATLEAGGGGGAGRCENRRVASHLANLGGNPTRGSLKVLAVIGSPRRGHSYELVQRIEQMFCQHGDVTVEFVPLAHVHLERCRGCYVCQSRGEQFCPLKDDLGVLVGQMKEADGVILVSPAYTGNVSALMKNLMDRIAWAAHRPPFIGKRADDEYHRDVDALGFHVAWWKKALGELAYRVVSVWLDRQLGTKE